MSLKVGIVGATGLVGETFRDLLAQSKYEFSELRLFASERSKGKNVDFKGKNYEIQTLSENCFEGLQVVFFSSGDDISLEWAPKAAQQGAMAIDNSAAFRMNPESALVVPEVNFSAIQDPLKPQVIANPNCSTIQLVMVLQALKDFSIKEVRVASYQSVSGAGKEAITELKKQTQDKLSQGEATGGANFTPPLAFDCRPVIGSLTDDHFCSEEHKIMRETKKILSLPDLKISASTVRIPTLNCHGESLWVTFDQEVSREQIEEKFTQTDFVQYKSEGFHSYEEVNGETDVFVSRLRKDPSFENSWMLWLVADNLYRGAASNGLLIAERIFDKLQ